MQMTVQAVQQEKQQQYAKHLQSTLWQYTD
jgi:hypothetical protein